MKQHFCIDPSHEIGFQIHSLSHEIKRCMDGRLALYGVDCATRVQTHIIGFLDKNEGRDVFQKDLEQEFDIRPSTISSTLRLMEKNGLIQRTSVPEDARLKKITLTARAREIHDRTGCEIRHMEQTLAQNLSKEEIDRFFHIMGIMRENLKLGGYYD